MHVPGAPHEGVSDEIDVVLHGPFDEAAVFFRHRRQVDRHARHIDALARPQRAAPHELAHQLLVGLVRHAEFQLPVGNQQPRTDRDIAYHRRHVEVDRIAGRRFAIGRPAHLHALPGLKADRTAVLVGHGRHTDFRSFGIQNDRNRRIDPAHRLDDLRGPLFGHMRRIDAYYVHSGLEKAAYKFFVGAEIRQRGYDLGFLLSPHTASC